MLKRKVQNETGECLKKKIKEEKPNYSSLARNKVAFSRVKDPNDTLVLRDISSKTVYDHFGVKGQADIEAVFYAILAILKSYAAEILPNLQFDQKLLNDLLAKMSREDAATVISLIKESENADTFTFQSCKVCYVSKEFPVIGLFNLTGNGDVKNGLYLFTSEAIKLLKHIVKYFHVSENPALIDAPTANIESYKDDDFF